MTWELPSYKNFEDFLLFDTVHTILHHTVVIVFLLFLQTVKVQNVWYQLTVNILHVTNIYFLDDLANNGNSFLHSRKEQ